MKGMFNFIRFLVAILLIGVMIYFSGRNNGENFCKITDITIEMDENAFVTNAASLSRFEVEQFSKFFLEKNIFDRFFENFFTKGSKISKLFSRKNSTSQIKVLRII